MVFDGEEDESLRVFTENRLILLGKLVVVLDRLIFLFGRIEVGNALDRDSDLVCVIACLDVLLIRHRLHLQLFDGRFDGEALNGRGRLEEKSQVSIEVGYHGNDNVIGRTFFDGVV